MSGRLLPYGDRGVLLECADRTARRAALISLESARPAGCSEIVPGDRTILLRFDQTPSRAVLLEIQHTVPSGSSDDTATGRRAVHDVPVRYDGPDLAAVADLIGTSTAEVIERHTGQLWLVEFCGFLPGFPYLTGVSGGMGVSIPRQQSPRSKVPAGAVGLAADYCGIYPTSSPGGWQLIGSTPLRLFDETTEPPNRLAPGDRVRFIETAA